MFENKRVGAGNSVRADATKCGEKKKTRSVFDKKIYSRFLPHTPQLVFDFVAD